MSRLPGDVRRGLPEDLRTRFAEIAERISKSALPPLKQEPEASLPRCDVVATSSGPALVRSVTVSRVSTGFEEVFQKLARLDSILKTGQDLDPSELGEIAAAGLERVVFLDLETTGFSSTPLFLAGTMAMAGDHLEMRQFFAKDYSQEKSVLQLVVEHLRGFRILVTFNGKSYDFPFLRERCLFHEVPLDHDLVHMDLLHPARRRWKNVFPDCRLVTLEWRLCGRRRVGDVHGSEIPAIYHEFVRRGHSALIGDIFHHNLLDLVTLAELLYEIASHQP